ncbi:MAG: hypothetical protein QW273_01365 [Candidatus Pacearchaeota archaeon]
MVFYIVKIEKNEKISEDKCIAQIVELTEEEKRRLDSLNKVDPENLEDKILRTLNNNYIAVINLKESEREKKEKMRNEVLYPKRVKKYILPNHFSNKEREYLDKIPEEAIEYYSFLKDKTDNKLKKFLYSLESLLLKDIF